MFHTPAAKRLKRSELFEDTSESPNQAQDNATQSIVAQEVDPDDEQRYHFDFEYIDTRPTAEPEDKGQVTNADEFSFNLFRPASKPSKNSTVGSPNEKNTSTVINRISIKSPSPAPDSVSAGRFDKPRPDSDYFTAALDFDRQTAVREQFAASAISGETVNHLSRLPWPGSVCSWRIISLPAHAKQIVIDKTTKQGRLIAATLAVTSASLDDSAVPDNEDNSAGRKRRRASKKRRIFLRVCAQKRAELQKMETKRLETEQEKRTKKNRERKVKRKMKEKKDKETKSKSEAAGIEMTPMKVG